MLKIFIGYDAQEPLAYHVLCHSILTRASGPVSFTPLIRSALTDCYQRQRGPLESTDFSMTRFLVPHLCKYGDFAIFMDCDMLCQGDIYEALRVAKEDKELRAVWVAKHNYIPSTARKFLNQPQTTYFRKNWSSFMIFRNKFCERLTPLYINNAQGLDLHRFAWTTDDAIGELPLEWNWLVGEYEKNPKAKMLHYTLGGPWFRDYQFCDHAELWFKELDLAFPTLNLPKPVEVVG